MQRCDKYGQVNNESLSIFSESPGMRDFKILGSISNKLNKGPHKQKNKTRFLRVSKTRGGGGRNTKLMTKARLIFNANEFNDWRQKRERSSVVSSKYLSLYVMILKKNIFILFSNGK
jgi:hypothetical protein